MEFLNEHQKGTVFFSLLHKYTFSDSLLCQTTKFCTLARKSIFQARTIICRTYVIICQWHGSTQVFLSPHDKQMRFWEEGQEKLSFKSSNVVLSANNTFYLHPCINRSADKIQKQIVEDLSCRYCESLKNARMEEKIY